MSSRGLGKGEGSVAPTSEGVIFAVRSREAEVLVSAVCSDGPIEHAEDDLGSLLLDASAARFLCCSLAALSCLFCLRDHGSPCPPNETEWVGAVESPSCVS